MTAEASMWATAIEYAFRAACMPLHDTGRQDTGGGCTPSEAANEWRFLTDARGDWAESRKIICWVNGVDPDVVRGEAIRRGISRQAKYGLAKGEERAALVGGTRNILIVEDYEAGRPVADIAAANGISVARVVQLAGQVGAKRPKHSPWSTAAQPKPDDVSVAIAADWAAGVPMDDMVRKYGKPAASISAAARKLKALRPDGWAAQNALIGSAIRKARLDAANAERNAEIARRHREGQSFRQIARDLSLDIKTVFNINKKAGSAVDDRGISRAARGGECVSFHAETMPAERRA